MTERITLMPSNDVIEKTHLDHTIDHNSENDPKKAAVGGAVAGAVVGALAGGPVGAVVGAVAGGAASDAGVAAVDKIDHDGSHNEHTARTTPAIDEDNVV